MVKNDSKHILDDLLARYHAWAKSYRANHQASQDPMFRNAKSGKSWDSTSEIIEDELMGSTMETVDFHISELPDDIKNGKPYRSAIYALARNLYTGRSVWLSPRLPVDPLERATIIAEARNEITRRLMRAGVL